MINTKEITFQEAIEIFKQTLRDDEDLYYVYMANIAMAYIDENRRQGSRDSYTKVHAVANQAAKNFLRQLLKQ